MFPAAEQTPLYNSPSSLQIYIPNMQWSIFPGKLASFLHPLVLTFSPSSPAIPDCGMKVKKKVLVIQLCSTLCNPMDCSPLGSSVHGISQARILERVAVSCSQWLNLHSVELNSWVSCIADRFFTVWTTRELSNNLSTHFFPPVATVYPQLPQWHFSCMHPWSHKASAETGCAVSIAHYPYQWNYPLWWVSALMHWVHPFPQATAPVQASIVFLAPPLFPWICTLWFWWEERESDLNLLSSRSRYTWVFSPCFPAHWVLFLSSQRCWPYAPLSPTPPLLLCPLANLLGPCSFKYTFSFCNLDFSFNVLHKNTQWE